MSEELEVIDHTTQELSKFDAIEAAIAEIKTQADAITVADHTDKANATKARNLRLTIKPQRIQADKLRKELKADGLKFLDMVEKKAQTVIKPLAAIEADLQTKEDIVAKHAEREAEKERQRIAAEQEAARKQLEADQARLAADRAELERQRAEIEKEKADAEAKRQHEADIAAAVESGRLQRIEEEKASRVAAWPWEPVTTDSEPRHQPEMTIETRALTLLTEFYNLNAAGVFTLPDKHYNLITATAQLISEATAIYAE